MVESYYNDNSALLKMIYPTKYSFVDDIYTEIESILSTCRLEDLETYLELYNDYDKGQQQKILYALIEYSLYDRFPDQFPLYETNYDELYNRVIINESLAGFTAGFLSILFIAAAAAVFTHTTPFNKVKWSIMTKFQEINEKIHKFIKDSTKKGRVKLALTFNNAEECYQKCKIKDKSDISVFIGGGYRQADSNDSIVNFETPKSREQAHCLTTCYLRWSLNQIDLLLQSYITCLRSTGERGVDMSDIAAALTSAPSSKMCDPYWKLLKDHRDNFKDVLDVVCKDAMEKEEYIRMYHETLNHASSKANNRINANSKFTLDKESFTNKEDR